MDIKHIYSFDISEQRVTRMTLNSSRNGRKLIVKNTISYPISTIENKEKNNEQVLCS